MANLFLTGSGVPTNAVGEISDYYRDTTTNLIYYRAALGWEVVPSLVPTPDGVGTNWLFGTGAPDNGIGSANDYYRDDANGSVYRKHAVNGWEAKGSLDFIGVYGVQWGEGTGAPANIESLNNLPAGSFYLDVATSDIYYKDNTLTWSLKGQLGGGGGGGGGGGVTVVQEIENNAATVPSSAVLFDFGQNFVTALGDKANESALDSYATLASLDDKANLDSPVFTGTPQVPTADSNTDDGTVASTAFVHEVVTAQVAGLWKDQGNFDASGGSWPTSANTLALDNIKAGYLWKVSVAGNLTGGIVVSVGDIIRALVDDAGNTAVDWAANEANIGYVPENASNKVTTLANPAVGTYPTTQTVVEALAANLDATVNTVTTTSYTLGDITTDNNGKTYLRMTSASANTVTIPSTQTKPISISQRGTGVTTLAADSGVTLNGDLTFSVQHQTKTVIPVGSSTFDVVG
jgi:hypothetical protein